MNKSFARKVVALCCIVAVFACYRLDAVRVRIINKSSGVIYATVFFISKTNYTSLSETIAAGRSKVLSKLTMKLHSLSWISGNRLFKLGVGRIKTMAVGTAYITIYNDGYYKHKTGMRKRASVEQLEGGRTGYFDSTLKRKK